MITLKIPSWMAKWPFFQNLMVAFQAWWGLVQEWVFWPTKQVDPLTCEPFMLPLLAYKRKIRRLNGESETTFRLRISTAFQNASEAGTIGGLRNIFQRLNIPVVDIRHKVEGRHWAVVEIHMTNDMAAKHAELVQEIVVLYGKLCRSCELTVVTPTPLYIRQANFTHSTNTFVSR